jgi:hypothetical protein
MLKTNMIKSMLGKLKLFLVVVVITTLGFESLNMSIMTWGLINSCLSFEIATLHKRLKK